MNKRVVFIPVLLGLSIALGVFIGSRLNFSSRPVALLKSDSREQKVRQIINYIDYEYVDEVDTDSLLDLTLTDMLHRLDPHSVYISNQNVKQSEERIQGSFEGIGIEFIVYKDTLTIVRVIPNGPAEKSKLKAGDRIIAVNDESIIAEDFYDDAFQSVLKGPSGSEVYVSVYRPMAQKVISEVKVLRAPIPIPSVDAAFMLDDTTGFIRINRFAIPTSKEFSTAAESLLKRGMKNLVLDLRDNPGGLLSACKDVANQFLDKDQLIVYTQNRQGDKEYYYAQSTGLLKKAKVSILINENSASASEILAGALQDNDRATIVGRRSFGKGLVQEEMKLNDGSRLRLTTSRYYTPTGRSIQKPYKEDGYEEYQKESKNRYNTGEMYSEDRVEVNENEKFVTPGGKVVYGGGGIVPDIYVPLDTNYKQLSYLYHIFGYNQMEPFVFEFVDENRGELDTIKGNPSAIFNLDIKPLVKSFIEEKQLSEIYQRMDSVSIERVETRMKALVAKNIWGSEVFYHVTLHYDPVVQRAREALFEPTDTVSAD